MQNIREKIKPTLNKVLSFFLLIAIAVSIITLVNAAAPNPGHNFTEVSGGVAQGDLLYGSAVDTLLALAKNITATRYLSNTGATNNPAWAQVDLTNGVTGILPTASGGTGIAFFTATGPTVARVYTFPDAAATVLTTNAAVTVAQGGTGLATLTANNVILGNGASAPLFVAPATSGNVLTSNATTWTSAAPNFQNNLLAPIGLYAANLTTATALTTNVSYFLYVGKVGAAVTSCSIQTRVATAAATITWAEVGIFTGTPVIGGAASLSRVGFTNVAATFNSIGIKTTAVTVSGVAIGSDLWVAFGSQATTPYQLRGVLADDIQSGVFQTFAGRISTMVVPSTATLASATQVPAWIRVKCT